jgi:uncharacterized protein YeaO (DUF488 family)
MTASAAPPYPVDLAARLITAWVYDRTVWQEAEFINLVSIPTPGVPLDVTSPYLMRLAPPADLLKAFRSHAITWADFQIWYTAHLATFYRWQSLEVVRDVLSRAPRIIVLGSEKPGAAGEAQVQCARRLFRAWLLGEVLG